MTKYIFHLSGENIELATYELLTLIDKKEGVLVDDLFLLNLKNINGLDKRLAFTHSIYKLLFVCDKKAFSKKITVFDWNQIIKKDYKVVVKGDLQFSEKELGSLIWHKLRRPKVNIKTPETLIVFFVRKNMIYASIFISDIDKSYLNRKPHLLPGLHPSGMSPKLAKAVVNILNPKKGSVVLDPFCGSCGLLIEVSLMGFSVRGYDLDQRMLDKAMSNFSFLNITDYKLELRDALSVRRSFSFIITDLPYGRGTRSQDILALYKSFLKILEIVLKKRAVVIFPSFVNYKNLIRKTRFKIVKHFSFYLHKSLGKNIIVLE
ncbi:MAG: N-6 DNA methylase [Nanoarchaeota archaeon]|nr:N-6 DNA methylase [Nanoarchaeota archaeon]